jgi:hypothetical protein
LTPKEGASRRKKDRLPVMLEAAVPIQRSERICIPTSFFVSAQLHSSTPSVMSLRVSSRRLWFPSRSLLKRQYTTYSQLPQEHKMIYETCREFADNELAPNAGTWDKKHEFPQKAVEHLVCIH